MLLLGLFPKQEFGHWHKIGSLSYFNRRLTWTPGSKAFHITCHPALLTRGLQGWPSVHKVCASTLNCSRMNEKGHPTHTPRSSHVQSLEKLRFWTTAPWMLVGELWLLQSKRKFSQALMICAEVNKCKSPCLSSRTLAQSIYAHFSFHVSKDVSIFMHGISHY